MKKVLSFIILIVLSFQASFVFCESIVIVPVLMDYDKENIPLVAAEKFHKSLYSDLIKNDDVIIKMPINFSFTINPNLKNISSEDLDLLSSDGVSCLMNSRLRVINKQFEITLEAKETNKGIYITKTFVYTNDLESNNMLISEWTKAVKMIINKGLQLNVIEKHDNNFEVEELTTKKRELTEKEKMFVLLRRSWQTTLFIGVATSGAGLLALTTAISLYSYGESITDYSNMEENHVVNDYISIGLLLFIVSGVTLVAGTIFALFSIPVTILDYRIRNNKLPRMYTAMQGNGDLTVGISLSL